MITIPPKVGDEVLVVRAGQEPRVMVWTGSQSDYDKLRAGLIYEVGK